MLFDSHAHYDDEAFDADRAEILASMPENRVGRIINVGADMPSSRRSVALSKEYSFIYAAVGIHPHDAKDASEAAMEELREMSREEKVVAIGEIGLDYHYDLSERSVQREWFARQLALSHELDLPFIIHEREALRDTLDILQKGEIGQGGVFHCFSESREIMREVLSMGLYVSFGGVLTFKNSVKAVEAAAEVPPDRFLIETDCPYLAPVPYRGKRNSSLYLHKVAEKFAELRGLTTEEAENLSWQNACRLFRMEETK